MANITQVDAPSSHSVKLIHPPKARSLIESPTSQSEPKRVVVRSLSMTEPSISGKLEHKRQHRSYGDNNERIKRHDSPSVTSMKSRELALQKNAPVNKQRRRKSRIKPERRFYEPSVERFPSERITRSTFKSIQEMPFWRLDAGKFRRTVSAFETREMANAKWRERTLVEMPFFSQPRKKLIKLFGEPGADRLELKRLKYEKKLAKLEWKNKRKAETQKKRLEMAKSRESRLIKVALKKEAYEKSKLEDEKKNPTTQVQKEVTDFYLGGLAVVAPPVVKPKGKKGKKTKHDNSSKLDITSENLQPEIQTLKKLLENGDVSNKKSNKAMVTPEKWSSSTEKPPVSASKSKLKPKGKVAEAISTIEGHLRNVSACRSCERNAYTAESIEARGQIFHNACFRCSACSTLLTRGNWNHADEKFYCNPCHKKLSLQTLRH